MDKFKEFLVKQNLAKNTISAYLTAVSGFKEHYEEVTKKHLLLYKTLCSSLYAMTFLGGKKKLSLGQRTWNKSCPRPHVFGHNSQRDTWVLTLCWAQGKMNKVPVFEGFTIHWGKQTFKLNKY